MFQPNLGKQLYILTIQMDIDLYTRSKPYHTVRNVASTKLHLLRKWFRIILIVKSSIPQLEGECSMPKQSNSNTRTREDYSLIYFESVAFTPTSRRRSSNHNKCPITETFHKTSQKLKNS